MTSGFFGASEHVGASICATQESRRPARARLMKPSIFPPSMSSTASRWSCGPPAFRSAVSWYGRSQPFVAGFGTQTVGTPFFIGIPSAPGIRAEERVERAVLLHDHDDVADLVDPLERKRRARVVPPAGQLGEDERRRDDPADDGRRNQDPPHEPQR